MIYRHTGVQAMAKTKIAVTIDESIMRQIDRLVRQGTFANRSQAIEAAARDKLARMANSRLARECAKLDPGDEGEMAEEGIVEDEKRWPPF
jgi:Arc/MetJ-type ribon-helix-helix transcriptional regulator